MTERIVHNIEFHVHTLFKIHISDHIPHYIDMLFFCFRLENLYQKIFTDR